MHAPEHCLAKLIFLTTQCIMVCFSFNQSTKQCNLFMNNEVTNLRKQKRNCIHAIQLSKFCFSWLLKKIRNVSIFDKIPLNTIHKREKCTFIYIHTCIYISIKPPESPNDLLKQKENLKEKLLQRIKDF